MSGYCKDCGWTQCICDEIAADEERRRLMDRIGDWTNQRYEAVFDALADQ